MKIAIVGSRGITEINIGEHIPSDCVELISGGAKGVDSCVREYALESGIALTEILPEYSKYGRAAPLLRNKTIVDMADRVIALWDGASKGTKWVIDYCKRVEKECKLIIISEKDKAGS